MKKKELWGYVILSIIVGLISSCQVSDLELGEDLLPPGDDVILYHDTVFDINTYAVSGMHNPTSENFNANKLLLLGNLQDTISGSSKATFISQFNSNSLFISGPNMEIDSLMLFFYVRDYFGDMNQEITVRVYELTERIYMDSVYTSDYNPAGRINPIPLVEKSFTPEDGTRLEFLIEDQDFRNKFLALSDDTALVSNDSIFKDFFNGFYVEADAASVDGTMARIHLANPESLLSLKYANDSTQVDSTAGPDFRWSQFSIDQFSCQKFNMFEHDHSGTYLSTIIDNENKASPYCYVQGMAGVNTRLSFESLDDWMEMTPIAISSATLVCEVVPEQESGIYYTDLPDRLMLGSLLEDGSYEPVYDYFVLWVNDNSRTAAAFGGYKKAESSGLFSDTTYTYRFRMGLHFQSMVDGFETDNNFVLQLADGITNPRIAKLWSNLPANNKRIRLEIVYLTL